jgi:LPS sulfotransferase NodH
MPQFDMFVIFAEMRTGSNFLESNLNGFEDLACLGEAFNPHFIGYPNRDALLGQTLAQRDSDPLALLQAMRAQDKLTGFRFFHDHDPRVLQAVLPDPRVAKIILTRNPVDSFVSRKIAAATGQWKLTNPAKQRSEQVTFDAAEFEQHLERLQEFQVFLLNSLQKSAQTAFYLAYEDLQEVEVMNGLARWLGSAHQVKGLDRKLKKQNPEPVEEKVKNLDQMERSLARLDRFNLSRTPNFEPRRGSAIPTLLATPDSPLLFLPIKGGPDTAVCAWMRVLDGGADLQTGFNFNALRQWKQAHPGHRSFAVLRNPLARAHAVLCDHILAEGPDSYPEIRAALVRTFGLVLPEGDGLDPAAHRAALEVFLRFLKANLSGQTALRTDPAWASQAAVLQGMASIILPDMILREDRLADGLAALIWQIGREDAPPLPVVTNPHAARLAMIHDAGLEKLARDALARDYLTFGFGDWSPA